MRAFLTACVAFVILGAGGYFVLNTLQEPSGAAYTSTAARIDAGWSWRAATTASVPQACKPRSLAEWFFVDFRHPRGEAAICDDSQ
jgi:hypothetical protein